MYSFTYSSHKDFFGGIVLDCGETRMGKMPTLPSRTSQSNAEREAKSIGDHGCGGFSPGLEGARTCSLLSPPGTSPRFPALHRWGIVLRVCGSRGAFVPGGPVILNWLHPPAITSCQKNLAPLAQDHLHHTRGSSFPPHNLFISASRLSLVIVRATSFFSSSDSPSSRIPASGFFQKLC